ncbi:swi5-dependent recombination DNA repair protein 1 homolog [Engraulis encrasicolus]|uniref:swi5-dependent recombination DNA repair protein 1 homolog n=1 Tax=Engraulis encrasicolus TaxID=184585 RepID=UPI002FD335C9
MYTTSRIQVILSLCHHTVDISFLTGEATISKIMDTTPKTQKSLSVYSPADDNDVNTSTGAFPSCERITMSSSLRQRLKRSRRSFTSPQTVAKRLNVDDADEDTPTSTANDNSNTTHLKTVELAEQTEMDFNQNKTCLEGSPRLKPPKDCAQPPETDALQLRDRLRREVKQKTETLRRLEMVKMYRKKNNPSQLRVLISKWRRCAQDVLYEMQTAMPVDGQKACLSQLIDHFGLEDHLLHYDRAEEDFKDRNKK